MLFKNKEFPPVWTNKITLITKCTKHLSLSLAAVTGGTLKIVMGCSPCTARLFRTDTPEARRQHSQDRLYPRPFIGTFLFRYTSLGGCLIQCSIFSEEGGLIGCFGNVRPTVDALILRKQCGFQCFTHKHIRVTSCGL